MVRSGSSSVPEVVVKESDCCADYKPVKTILILILAWLTVNLNARAAAPVAVTPKQIAAWKIPCEKVPCGCIEYAICLNYVLFQKGIPSRMVGYHYGGVGGHVVVLFELGGKNYLIDNETDKAHVVTGSNDLERIQSFDSDAVGVVVPNYGPEAALYLEHLAAARAKYGF